MKWTRKVKIGNRRALGKALEVDHLGFCFGVSLSALSLLVQKTQYKRQDRPIQVCNKEIGEGQ